MNGTWNVECRRRPGGGYTCELMVDSSAGLVSVRGEALPALAVSDLRSVPDVAGLGATLGGLAGGVIGAFAGGAGAPVGAAAGAALGAGLEAAFEGTYGGPVIRPGGLPAEASAANLLRILQHIGATPATSVGQLRGLLNGGLAQNWAGADHNDARRLLEMLPPFGQYENTPVGALENLANAAAQRAAAGQSAVPMIAPTTTPPATPATNPLQFLGATSAGNPLSSIAPYLAGILPPGVIGQALPGSTAGNPLAGLGVLGSYLGGGQSNPLAGLLANPQLLGQLISPQLLGLVMQNPQLLGAIMQNPQALQQLLTIAPIVAQSPAFMQYLAANPSLLPAIIANPQLLQLAAANPQLLQLAAANPQLLQLLPLLMQNPTLMQYLPLLLRGGIAPTPMVSGLLPENVQGPGIATYGAISRAARMVPSRDVAVRGLLACARQYLDAFSNAAAGIPGGPHALARSERAAAIEGGAARDGRRLALAGLMRGGH